MQFRVSDHRHGTIYTCACSTLQSSRVKTHSTGEGECWYGHQWPSTNKLAVGNFEKSDHQGITPVCAEDNVAWNMKTSALGSNCHKVVTEYDLH